jgi:hypothetical protein
MTGLKGEIVKANESQLALLLRDVEKLRADVTVSGARVIITLSTTVKR